MDSVRLVLEGNFGRSLNQTIYKRDMEMATPHQNHLRLKDLPCRYLKELDEMMDVKWLYMYLQTVRN